tara:strand:+ start:4658 stop:4891 length:234 start_codon:yes stop_codon:yes gene_type:complete
VRGNKSPLTLFIFYVNLLPGSKMRKGKAKLFGSRKDLDGQFHRGKKGRCAAKAKKHKRSIEKSLRSKSKEMCRNHEE